MHGYIHLKEPRADGATWLSEYVQALFSGIAIAGVVYAICESALVIPLRGGAGMMNLAGILQGGGAPLPGNRGLRRSSLRLATHSQGLPGQRTGKTWQPEDEAAEAWVEMKAQREKAAHNRANDVSRRDIFTKLLSSAVLLPMLPSIATLPAARVAAAVVSEAALRVYPVKGAPLDPRSYRGLVLANGLRVLLASDPTTAKGAASMDVRVGYYNDPDVLPGLAHFCEHMLFLGSKAYPDEGEFDLLIGNAGGSSNAFTAGDETNYFFNVQGSTLPAALKRYAGFFTAPLFTQSATSREVSAIESEFSRGLLSEYFRYEQVFKLRARPEHPFRRFGAGNRRTLRDGDAVAREALLKFHARYYQADQMSLTLVGPQSLNDLQDLAVKNFGAVPAARPPVPSASEEYDSLPLPFFPADETPKATLLVPVKDQRSLKIAWCVPVSDLERWIKSKPDDVWSLLVSNGGKGGLLPVLRRKGLANDLSATTEEFTRSFIILTVSIDLTLSGLSQWKEVASLLFAYLRMLSAAGVPEYLVTEYASMLATGFEYAEPTAPESFARAASGALEFYEPEQWVSGPATMEPGADVGAAEMLAFCADPRNAIVTLISPSLARQATQTEPIYGAKYGTIPLSSEVRAWSTSKPPAGVAPPQPNPFLPKDFGIRCSPGGKSLAPAAVCLAPKVSTVAPKVIIAKSGLTLHFLQDSTFLRPKAAAFFLFRSPFFYDSPKASITYSLLVSMVGETLQDITYQASLAGMQAGVGADYTGFIITASGYNDRLPELIQSVATQIKSAKLEKSVFERERQQVRQELGNFFRQQPVGLASYWRSQSLERPIFAVEELAKAVDEVTLADIQAYQQALLPECLLEAFLVGNLNEEEARGIVAQVTAALPSSKPLKQESIPRRQVRVLPRGRSLRQYVVPNPDEANSATEVYLQIGPDVGDDWLHLAVLYRLLEQRFFGELRTKQQLGYVVQSNLIEIDGIRGIVLDVQSAVLPPDQVEARIDAFLKEFRAVIVSLPEEEFTALREGLATSATDVDKRLANQASRFWSEISQRRYDYGRPWRISKRFRGVKRDELLAFYDARIVPGAPESRRLATHVFTAGSAPEKPQVDSLADDFFPPPVDRFALLEGGDMFL